MGHVGSKTGRLDKICQKTLVRSTVQIFSLTVMKHGQNVCHIMTTWANSKMGHLRSKTRSNPRKTLCMLSRPYFLFNTLEIWSKCLLWMTL